MTGGSLGLRASGSYGLLQQHPLNGGLPPQNLYIPRRPSKSSLNGYKEKERHVHSIFRYLSQRKVGMLVLASLALVAFTTGFFTVNNEADLGNSSLDFDTRHPNMSHVLSSLWTGKEAMLYNSSIKMNKVTVCVENAGWYPSISHASAADVDPSTASFSDDPCKNFAFPPPPPGDRRRVGPRPCPVCYIPVEHAIASIPKFPSESSVLSHLTYFSEENPLRTEPNGGSEFGGYPSLKQRKDSFDIKESMTVHCGFVKGCGPRDQTGFDIDADDLKELEQFHEVIVASAIFGNYDVIQQPRNIGEVARKNVPFFMFIDKETEAYMKNTSVLDGGKQVGLWRIIVVQNVPYNDARRNGKVPKLLLHRLFSNVRYSIWIDGKLRLVVDPYQILEKYASPLFLLMTRTAITQLLTFFHRFLWRQNATFAISRHYSRFDVFEEAEANKAAGKYDNTSIDHQIDYYKKEGLTPYTLDKLPITSDVPEGCVIIREHIPMTNLFSCLWFNEVDRFTSRDQLSFAIVRDKVKERVNWNINMFLDCERRNFVIQAYHRDLLEQRAHQQAMTRIHPPPVLIQEKNPVKRNLVRPGRGSKKPSSRRRHKIIPRNKENFFI